MTAEETSFRAFWNSLKGPNAKKLQPPAPYRPSPETVFGFSPKTNYKISGGLFDLTAAAAAVTAAGRRAGRGEAAAAPPNDDKVHLILVF